MADQPPQPPPQGGTAPPPPPRADGAEGGEDGGAAAGGGGGGDGPLKPWYGRHLWQIQPVRDLLVLAGVAGLVYLGYVLRTVTVPMLAALLLAYLMEPVVTCVERLRYMSRQGAVAGIIAAAVTFIALPAALGAAFAVIQAVDLAQTTVGHVDRITTVTSFVNEHRGEFTPRVDDAGTLRFHTQPPDDPQQTPPPPRGDDQPQDATEQNPDETDDAPADPLGPAVDSQASREASKAWAMLPPVLQSAVLSYARGAGPITDEEDVSAGEDSDTLADALEWLLGVVRGNASSVAQAAFQGGRATLATGMATLTSVGLLLFTLFLTGFFFFFFSTGYARVREFGHELLPEKHRERIVDLLGQMDVVVAGFVRGRLTIAFIQSLYFMLAYWLVGVPAPLILGPIVGVLSAVPYVALIGIPLTVVAMAIDNTGWYAWQQTWWWTLIGPIAVYQAGQLMDDYLLTPLIQGKTTKMDTPTILFASIGGGILAGVYGLLLAIPVAACAKILIRELFWPRLHAWLRGEARDFLPIRR